MDNNKRKQDPEPRPLDDATSHQTDLAEGELETVEESIREHEKKGDAQGKKQG